MMKSEFIERVKFEPTEKEYAEIEAEYMGTDIDKDEFCKQWKKNGGVERLMRLRARRIEELEGLLAKAEKDYDRMESNYRQRINAMNESKDRELDICKHNNEVLKNNQRNLEGQLQDAMARADEAERKLAVLKEAFAIITGKETE